jgi:hypothetical protein
MLLSFHEFASDSSGVLVANLIDLDSVITAIEGDNEFSAFIIGFGGNEISLESENVHVLFKHFLHVKLGWLWLEGVD